jgi:glutaminase
MMKLLIVRQATVAMLALLAAGMPAFAEAPTPAAIEAALQQAYDTYKGLQEGANADYIPALAEVDPNLWGIALVTTDGTAYTKGDVTTEVSIQSISKVFTMAKVMEASGPMAIYDNMGVDATGQVFNAIEPIEWYKGHEMNAMVNAGAITATSMVEGSSYDEIWNSILDYYNDFAGRKLVVLEDVYESEAASNQRNQALAELMFAYGRIDDNPEQATDIYTRQCSVGVNAKDLAVMAATLANGGTNPVTGKMLMNDENVPEVLAVMATAGLYDDAGKWLFKTGLPAKSGVGGGILAVAPGLFGIAAVSPPLDKAGNSVRAQRAIADIVAALDANPYHVEPR